MSRLDSVIESVKLFREGENVPWIFDKDGNIKEDVLIVDVLPLLLALKECEIEISNSELINYLEETDYISAENTYNWGALISNDLNWRIYKNKNNENNIALIEVHLFGDARSGYSDWFAISIENYQSFMEFIYYEDFYDEITRWVNINDTFFAECDIFSNTYDVYGNDGSYLDSFYEIEKADLLREIEEKMSLKK